MVSLWFCKVVRMVLIVPLVGPSALWVCFRMVFPWVSFGFLSCRMVLIAPFVDPSALGFVFVRCSYSLPMVL